MPERHFSSKGEVFGDSLCIIPELGGHAEPTVAESGSAFVIRSGNDGGLGVG